MPALSDAQVDVLRKVVKDTAFRQSFIANPEQAALSSGFPVSASEAKALGKITPQAVNQLTSGLKSANIAADGTHTLLYAVAIATLIA